MNVVSTRLVITLVLLAWADGAWAQTADEVVERALTAAGGRAALSKLKSRAVTGTITLSLPVGEVSGSVETLNAVPNKSRSLIKADLTAIGAGPWVLEQRFDGSTGYAMDTLQGNREITGNQLDNLRNNVFPHPFLNYKEMGMTIKLAGREKVGDRDAFVLMIDPTSGSAVKQYIDAETYLPIRMTITVNVPQVGRDIEQTTDMSDFREVDGVKLPFRIKASSALQNYTIVVTKVEHNVKVDESLFAKPPAP